MRTEQLRTELYETYMKYYVSGFKNNDIASIDKIIHYPLAYIKNANVMMCNSFPLDPESLKAEKEWDHSTDWKFDITAINEHEAHAVASATRCRKDGSKIESVHGFYAFTKTSDGWKIYALADTTF